MGTGRHCDAPSGLRGRDSELASLRPHQDEAAAGRAAGCRAPYSRGCGPCAPRWPGAPRGFPGAPSLCGGGEEATRGRGGAPPGALGRSLCTLVHQTVLRTCGVATQHPHQEAKRCPLAACGTPRGARLTLGRVESGGSPGAVSNRKSGDFPRRMLSLVESAQLAGQPSRSPLSLGVTPPLGGGFQISQSCYPGGLRAAVSGGREYQDTWEEPE
ncbi:uncharacterized protein LOC106025977 [Cavia porcellus]|uniref:uncharacterized protein LOC106025977 n=1 Tax=Cavia porcellus TaxID=10141 RepID=UPI000661BA24